MSIDKSLFETEVSKIGDLLTLKVTLKQRVYATDPVVYWNSKISLEYLQEHSGEKSIGACVGQSSVRISSTIHDKLPFTGQWVFAISPKPTKKPPPKSPAKPRTRRTATPKKSVRKRMAAIAEDAAASRKKE